MIFWKIYFCFMTLMNILFLLQNIAKPTLGGLVGTLVNTPTLVALFGLSFNKKLFFKKFWQLTFFACITIEVFNTVKAWPQIVENNTMIVFTAIWYIIAIPIYIATFLYAFRKDILWHPADKRAI